MRQHHVSRDLAQQLIKDPYTFDFLTLAQEAQERDLERGLLAHLRQFLIELGVGFAFVGSQVPIEVGGEDFKIDLLFYHLDVRVDPEKKFLSGKNTIRFKMLRDDTRIQLDLTNALNVDKILFSTTLLKYERDSGAVFVVCTRLGSAAKVATGARETTIKLMRLR